ncbi:MAG: peptidoglycan-binding protein, partial [Clostridia bacterium]|nr:peptidoglycan-binding protein [Clostridia bacterium]
MMKKTSGRIEYKRQNLHSTRGRGYAVLKALRIPAFLLAAALLVVILLAAGKLGRNVNDGHVIDVVAGTPAPIVPTSGDPGGPTPEPMPSVEPDALFKVGDDNNIIVGIQSRLMALGYLESDEPSSRFGYPLETAVRLFQRANNMTQTGEVDALLISLLYSDSPAQYVIEYGNIGNDVRMVQERLNQLGYYNDKINGYYGTATLGAVETFQQYNELEVSGKTDSATFNRMFSFDCVSLIDPSSAPILTEEPIETVEPTPLPTEPPSAVPTVTPEPSETSRPTPSPRPTPTPSPRPTPTPTPTPRPTPTPEPIESGRPTPTPSPRPTPSPTPTPT